MSKLETKVEILYPEYGNQGGDNGNYMYVEACLSPEHIVSTTHDSKPYSFRYCAWRYDGGTTRVCA